jgi:chromosome partitioning protein
MKAPVVQKELDPPPGERSPQPTRPRRLLVSSPKGGSGKTHFSRNLAVAAALNAYSVATADFDRQRTLTKWWSRRPSDAPAIAHYAAEMSDAEEFLHDVNDHDLLIIDTPPGVEEHPTEIKALLLAADVIIIPTQVYVDDLESVSEWMRLVQSMGRRGIFLLNRVNRRARSLLNARRRLIAVGPLCPLEVPQYESFAEAAAAGVGILEIRGAQGADDIMAVWQHIRGELKMTDGAEA